MRKKFHRPPRVKKQLSYSIAANYNQAIKEANRLQMEGLRTVIEGGALGNPYYYILCWMKPISRRGQWATTTS